MTGTITPPSPPAPGRERPDSTALNDALEAARAAVDSGSLPGAVVGVANADGPLAIEVFRGPRAPRLRADGLFFLASITKPIVATALMRLVDSGAVDLQAPVARYVPEFAGPGKESVTVWHVLTHTSGIPDIDVDVLRQRRPSGAQITEMVCRDPLRFEPGSRYEYCSSSFYLLAEIIARKTGRPFASALRALVLRPAGMTDTSFDPRYARRRIVPVEGVPLRNRIVRELVLRYLARAALPGGGLWGTAADMLGFGQALLPSVIDQGRGLLSRRALDEMTREQTRGILEVSDDGAVRDPRYALGWGKPRVDGGIPSVVGGAQDRSNGTTPASSDTVPASVNAFTHGGASGARLWIDPDIDLVFVFLTNLWGAGDGPMFATLARVYEAFGTSADRSIGTLTIEPHSVHEPS